jgi:MerR family transcriptional regulator/heat shock protein HspR
MGGSDDVTVVLYRASDAARLAGITLARLRRYEAAGLLAPARHYGRVRYYTAAQVALLRRIRRLHEELGVNLAGIEIILRLLARLEREAAGHPLRDAR